MLIALLLVLVGCQEEEAIGFNEHIRPIFNAKCIGCHGGVKQAGGFGLVFRDNAVRETTSGRYAIVPGKPGRSEILRRIRHDDPELRMPLDRPALAEAEIDLLERWIAQGARWEEHWAYLPPTAPPVPAGDTAWGRTSVDRFVLAALRERSLAPAPAAPPRELLRRVSFDLTGLPPRPALATLFLEESISYEQLVDSLLSELSYGEKWAAHWLDLARYADSRGYERDAPRNIWRYRDWVIEAYNRDIPYDRFVTEQLAGDLLPDPTEAQLVATGFHRNTMSNEEGGTENEEYRVVAVMDRVNTTWEVFQGTTLSCVQCHAHPYDPFRHEAYYTAYALFNNTVDHDHATEAPVLRTLPAVATAKHRRLQEWVEKHGARSQVRAWDKMIRLREPRLRPDVYEEIVGGVFTGRADEDVLYLGAGHGFRLPAQALDSIAALHVQHRQMAPGTLRVHRDDRSGPLVGELVITDPQWRFQDLRIPLTPTTGRHALYFSVASPDSGRVVAIDAIGLEPALPGHDEAGYADIVSFVGELIAARDSVTTPVMVEAEGPSRRTTHRFVRGNWLVPGEVVSGGVPELLATPGDTAIDDRLDFARWLFRPGQPLTARVAVNRVWGQLFGRGIVATPEDFGSQGAPPSHPRLLDHLAVTFADSLEWRQKDLLRLLVNSATYRQASRATPEELTADPQNRWLARGPRKRLTAEQVRDQALAVSGLLSDKMYGPGVMPPQPDGLWAAIPYSSLVWTTSEGEDRHRRAIYTYLRRSVVHPVLTTFDGPNREFCLSRRITTNTPLQALMTLNDPAYLEAAEALAARIDAAIPLDDQLSALYDRLLYRPPAPEELAVLRELYAEALATYRPERTAPARAALTVVANALLNLDEFLTLS